jgi:putative toxin-antitoxin system antitoxin component (TIGR02293 family)
MEKYILPVDLGSFASEPAVAFLSAYSSYESDADLTVIHHARKGMKMGYLLYLAQLMDFGLSDIASLINVSLRTVQRYGRDFVLDADASSKVIQLSMLNAHGKDVFGDQHIFNQWLREPVIELDGRPPLEFLDTPFGYRIVHQILGRIEHGIFA